MPKEVSIEPLPIFRFTGVIDFDRLYSSLVTWFKDQKYAFFEDKYIYKGSEIEIGLRGEKAVTPWVKYAIEVEIKILDAKDVDIIVDDEKKRMVKGRLQFVVKAKYTLDPEKRWEGNWLLEQMRDFYYAYLIRSQIKGWHGDLMKKARELYKLVKEITQVTARE
ncbi:hypothetical protein HY639_00855 [Candidatus Woesearchaeota archaeon]|nr:hypothetical protein [Candidatus Woesearchaeota archaeon]